MTGRYTMLTIIKHLHDKSVLRENMGREGSLEKLLFLSQNVKWSPKKKA